MTERTAPPKTASLDEVMLAMDVVDTLRHRRKLLEQELDAEDRDQRLRERLRKIYATQGIEVPDHVLDAGVSALKEGRFAYKPPADRFATRLARIYVSRNQWGQWVVGVFAALIVVWGAYYFMVLAPRSALPGNLQAMHQSVLYVAKEDKARQLADQQYIKAQTALRAGDEDRARAALKSLKDLRTVLEQEYLLRIVNRPGERSGVWRIPDLNPSARNYYIVVEALDTGGAPVKVAVTTEETGETESVSQWALRVDEQVFREIAADKQDDGIIQNNRFGIKRRGYLEPDYQFPTTGAAITRW